MEQIHEYRVNGMILKASVIHVEQNETNSKNFVEKKSYTN